MINRFLRRNSEIIKIKNLRKSIFDKDDLILFDEAFKCFENKAYRASLILIWICIATSLRNKFLSMAVHDSEIGKIVKKIKQAESQDRSTDKFILKQSLAIGIVFSYEDEVAGFKQIVNFHEEADKLEIKQGGMNDKVLSSQEILELSKLPSKNELIATLITRIKGPAFGLVNVLQAGQKNLVYVLKAITDSEFSSKVPKHSASTQDAVHISEKEK